MGRDFTPKQIHDINTKVYPGLYMSNVIWTTADGKSTPMYSEEDMSIRKEFPIFATIFTDRFLELYHWAEKNGYTERVKEIEKMLTRFVEQEKTDDISSYPTELVKWYRGELDPHFHYHEENDELFYDWLINWISGTEFPVL